jgi:hypothetical protein
LIEDNNKVYFMSDLLEGLNVIQAAAKLVERLSLRKRAAQKFDMQGFDLKKLNNAKVREQCQVKISNRLTA